MLVMQKLEIQHYSWEKEPSGTIQYRDGEGSEVKIKLTAEHIRRILPIVGEALVATSKEVAQSLTVNIIDAQFALPAPETEDGER